MTTIQLIDSMQKKWDARPAELQLTDRPLYVYRGYLVEVIDYDVQAPARVIIGSHSGNAIFPAASGMATTKLASPADLDLYNTINY